MTRKNISKIEKLIKELLIQIGEDPDREGILRTPKRVAKAWEFLAKGYNQNLDNKITDDRNRNRDDIHLKYINSNTRRWDLLEVEDEWDPDLWRKKKTNAADIEDQVQNQESNH